MNIRPFRESDTPAVVALLKASLGEISSPKSSAYWNWKHVENCFGKSPVLVAEEGNTLAGVRAFMRWKWQYKDTVYSALRAVDTATHPSYQGKGIFKKLTLSLLDFCVREGDDFVFNTPNQQSKPGYLKMGWREIGKVPVNLSVRNPLKMGAKKIGIIRSTQPDANRINEKFDLAGCLGALESLHNCQQSGSDNWVMSVPVKSYIQWRYLHCPTVRYYGYVNDKVNPRLGFIFYPKVQKWGIELRICECYINGSVPPSDFRLALRSVAGAIQADYISVGFYQRQEISEVLRSSGFMKMKSLGPVVTFRELGKPLPEPLFEISHWQCSLGNLELF